MKMYTIIYDAGFDEEVNETLTACRIKGFTKWNRVLGKGERSDPKMNDSVWPGFNCTIMMAVDPSEEEGVNQALKKLYKQVGSGGIRVYAWAVEQVL